ncbi:4-hydroxy-tetrahydrodipicolinate reductase [Sporosalibacterium faouarense]|uniref:4-hydroxy-tetrahydrodipicolinate reductase n=1 Tax=Sporosalibacterium faouarense TaxID=516123 RepID=UPI00141C7DE8|nr:4-hydroxy-tetrahydrodipicolinate reductase [Sporosalibacterium faouarense]MTI48718.1 4-hydroxy-tetrahydrodipicolinate reductase [Bacillota bacterium]
MIKVILYGCNGKMGQVMSNQLMMENDFEIVAGIDRDTVKHENNYPVYNSPYDYKEEVDIIIDFSHTSYLEEMLEFAVNKRIPLVIATTGLTKEHMEGIQEASKNIPILYSSNMSLGVNVLRKVLRQISPVIDESFDIEIIEKHHNKKLDAPSGTAYLLANTINESLSNKKEYVYGREGKDARRKNNEIGIHAIRGGTIAGEHSVIFAGLDEVIEIKHTALSKNIFAMGAIRSAKFIIESQPGFYTIDDIF